MVQRTRLPLAEKHPLYLITVITVLKVDLRQEFDIETSPFSLGLNITCWYDQTKPVQSNTQRS